MISIHNAKLLLHIIHHKAYQFFICLLLLLSEPKGNSSLHSKHCRYFFLFIDYLLSSENVFANHFVSTSDSIFQRNNCILPFSSNTSAELDKFSARWRQTMGTTLIRFLKLQCYSGHFEIMVIVSFYTLTLS